MSVPRLLNIIQNGARARLRSVALPHSKAAVGIAQVLLDHGFIHNFTLGTTTGASPAKFRSAGVSAKRLWVDLKYGHDDRAVLEHCSTVSKPSRKVVLDCSELLRYVTGRRAQFVKPLGLGEIAIVRCEVEEEVPKSSARPLQEMIEESREPALQWSLPTEPDKATSAAPKPKMRRSEKFVEAREAVGRGWGGEIVARVG